MTPRKTTVDNSVNYLKGTNGSTKSKINTKANNANSNK